MYLGQYQLGDWVFISIRTQTNAALPAKPDAAPSAQIYDTNGIVATLTLPSINRHRATGIFGQRLFLGTLAGSGISYSAGKHFVYYEWAISATAGASLDVFDIVASGHADGTPVAMTHYDRPHADFLLFQLDGGKLVRGRNPQV